ncbi:MAG: type II secretion system minor pseudopilin GspJ [Oleiphilaceae bacterium]|nr:type II secretion system minor pseudopilin GspJ [Oleiphilaceae bacterium]
MAFAATPRARRRCPSGHAPEQQGGFTLLEILVAVLITGMLGLGIWQVMNGLIASRESVDRVSGQFKDVHRSVMLLERDLFQAVDRAVRDSFGDPRPAMSSRERDAGLTLTRQGWRNPLGQRRSELQRVAWQYDELEKTLMRRYWTVLDRAQGSEPREQLLLENVLSMEVRFLNHSNEWVEDWPQNTPDASSQDIDPTTGEARDKPAVTPSGGLPKAVEVSFEHERFGLITRLIDLGGFSTERIRQNEREREQQRQQNQQEGQQP